MKKILIGGDSWGCGEFNWHNKKHVVTHKGLEQYLCDDGFVVANCSQPGSSNRKSISRVSYQPNLSEYDHIIWFQSDPFRDLAPYNKFNSMFNSYQQLLDCSNELLNSSYNTLNQLGNKVICIGGCSKLDPDIHNYENLIPLVDSVVELILPTVTAPQVWCSGWIHFIDSSTNETLLDQLLIDKKIQDQIGDDPMFIPDGYHPNRDGHRVLFDVVRKFLA
jgi:hypothetical protein